MIRTIDWFGLTGLAIGEKTRKLSHLFNWTYQPHMILQALVHTAGFCDTCNEWFGQ